MERTCRYCDALRQCPYLSDSTGGFVPERLVTIENPRDCDGWSPITPRQDSFRQRLCDSSAFVGAMKFVHSDLPGMLMKDLIVKEMEEARMQGETPDFAAMLRQGMTTEERENQLRYEVDEQGNIALDDSGRPIYRPCYQLKQFVTGEGSHVKLELPVVWFWTTNQLVDHILRAEVEQGLLTKVKKQKKQETEMAGEGRRVMVHQGGKAAPPPAAAPAAAAPQPQPQQAAPVSVQMGGPGRVATPPARSNVPAPAPVGVVGPGRPPMPGPQAVNPKIGTPPVQAQPAPAAQAAPPVEEGPVENIVRRVVEGCLDNLSNEIRLAIGTEVKKQLEELRNELVQQIEAARVQMLQSVTLAYDVAVQTNGQYWYPQVDENGQQVVVEGQPQFQQAPQCWDNPDLILGLVPQGE